MCVTVEFKIVSKKNPQVYCEGYVNINDEFAEDVDWFYWNGTQYQGNFYIHHDGEKITGLTDVQNNEIDDFKNDYLNDSLWIDDVILQSNDDEHETYSRENCIITIN